MESQARIKEWCDLINKDDLESVEREIAELSCWKLNDKLNKTIFKILIYLSHTAERCKPTDIRLVTQMANIACNVCTVLLEIPDVLKFISCIYFFTKKLIAAKLYDHAFNVCEYLWLIKLPSNIVSAYKSMFVKIANLWQEATATILKSLCTNFDERDYQTFEKAVKLELRIVGIGDSGYTKLHFDRIMHYLQEFSSVSTRSKTASKCRQDFERLASCMELDPSCIEKYSIYQRILGHIYSMDSISVKGLKIEYVCKVVENRCQIFLAMLSSDRELFECLSSFKRMVLILLNLNSNIRSVSDQTAKSSVQPLAKIVKRHWKSKSMLCNMVRVGTLLQDLIPHWENGIKLADKELLNVDALQELIELSQFVSAAFADRETTSCMLCYPQKCQVDKDIYSASVVSIKVMSLVSKIPSDKLAIELFPSVQQILGDILSWIEKIKNGQCIQWTSLWAICGTAIYNLAVGYHKKSHEQSVHLFSILAVSIVRFEGRDVIESVTNIQYPLSTVLYRLSNVHYIHGHYREAMTPCALGSLLDSTLKKPVSKSFRFWACIKQKLSATSNTFQTTMLDCLRDDMDRISEIGIDVSLASWDFRELCLNEMKGLTEVRYDLSIVMEAAFEKLVELKPDVSQYIAGVRIAGNYFLHSKFSNNFLKHLQKVTEQLRSMSNKDVTWSRASADIELYTFFAHLQNVGNKTLAEMETNKFALRATKSDQHELRRQSSDTVVPAYTMINVTEDAKLFDHLDLALKKWSSCVEKHLKEITNGWHPHLTLHNIVITAEYCRLHQFLRLEITAWNLAYKLSLELDDKRTCVRAVARIISLRRMSCDQIAAASKFVEILKISDDTDSIDTVATYWLSLLDYYFEMGKREEGNKLMDRIQSLPKLNQSKTISTYISTIDSILRNDDLNSDYGRGKQYMLNIVRCLYSIVRLIDQLQQPSWGHKEKQLYGYDVLLTCTANLALRMNSMFSFKEISSHLMHRLKMAQTLGATLRAAECLKYLCFMDLSRVRLEDCEVKLQGLEYILRTESSQMPVTKKLERALSEPFKNQIIEPVRDAPTGDASPVLRKYTFSEPDFLTHEECTCYKCSSASYQYLVFSCAYIRGQLYVLQGYINEAIQYFEGAFIILNKLLSACAKTGDNNRGHLWASYSNTIDYVLFLLDFSRFISEYRTNEEHEELNIAGEALDICNAFGLQNHPIYISAKELILAYQFSSTFKESDFAKFTVAQTGSIDLSRYTKQETSDTVLSCSTPPSNIVASNRKARRAKTPPLLKLTKVPIDLSNDEDISIETSPKTSKRRERITTKSSARKNLDKYLSETSTTSDEDLETSSKTRRKASRLTKTDPNGLKLLINEASYAVPHIKRRLAEIDGDDGLTEAEKIDMAIRLVEGLGIVAESNGSARTRKSTRQLSMKSRTSNDHSDKIESIIQAFRKIVVSDANTAIYAAQYSSGDESSSCSLATSRISLPSIEVTSVESTTSSDNENSADKGNPSKHGAVPKNIQKDVTKSKTETARIPVKVDSKARSTTTTSRREKCENNDTARRTVSGAQSSSSESGSKSVGENVQRAKSKKLAKNEKLLSDNETNSETGADSKSNTGANAVSKSSTTSNDETTSFPQKPKFKTYSRMKSSKSEPLYSNQKSSSNSLDKKRLIDEKTNFKMSMDLPNSDQKLNSKGLEGCIRNTRQRSAKECAVIPIVEVSAAYANATMETYEDFKKHLIDEKTNFKMSMDLPNSDQKLNSKGLEGCIRNTRQRSAKECAVIPIVEVSAAYANATMETYEDFEQRLNKHHDFVSSKTGTTSKLRNRRNKHSSNEKNK